MNKTPENPAVLHEIARRQIEDGEVVLKAAGLTGVHRVEVEVQRDGKIEHPPIPTTSDAFTDAWSVYSNYGKPSHPRKAA